MQRPRFRVGTFGHGSFYQIYYYVSALKRGGSGGDSLQTGFVRPESQDPNAMMTSDPVWV